MWHLNEGNKTGIEIKSKNNIVEKMQTYVYKVTEDNVTNKAEVIIGIRDSGFIEVVSGLVNGDNIVAEGLKKVRPRGKIKPIKK